jgi:hypothetical protein
VNKPQEESIKDRIIGLLEKGYTRSQLIGDLNFAERTVDNAIKEYKERHGDEPDEVKKGDDSDTRALAIPAKLDIKQVIAPEYLIKHLSFVNGDQRQTFIDALLVYEAARRSVMEDVTILQGLAAAQAQTTETQLRVLREAKSESSEVAKAAAEEAAWRVGKQVQEAARQAAASVSPNPFASMLSQTIQPYLSQMFANMFGMFAGFGQPPGMMPGAPPPQGAPAGFQQPQPGQPGFRQPAPGFQEATEDEVKEAFDE